MHSGCNCSDKNHAFFSLRYDNDGQIELLRKYRAMHAWTCIDSHTYIHTYCTCMHKVVIFFTREASILIKHEVLVVVHEFDMTMQKG